MFQISSDIFPTNSSYSPIPPEQTLRQNVVNYLERERPFKPFQFEDTPPCTNSNSTGNNNNKRRRNDVVYSYIQKPSTGHRSKIIRIQVFDAEDFTNSPCDCSANICVQHVVGNVFNDDIYKCVKDIVSKLHKKM